MVGTLAPATGEAAWLRRCLAPQLVPFGTSSNGTSNNARHHLRRPHQRIHAPLASRTRPTILALMRSGPTEWYEGSFEGTTDNWIACAGDGCAREECLLTARSRGNRTRNPGLASAFGLQTSYSGGNNRYSPIRMTGVITYIAFLPNESYTP